MELIDTHCHLDDARFEHCIGKVLARAAAAGVSHCIIPGIHREQWEQLSDRKFPQAPPVQLHFACGLHPWFCDQHTAEDIEELSSRATQVIAIGECGLDFSSGKPDVDKQLRFFRAQLRIAAERELPVIVHAVRSLDITSRELRALPALRGVIHGFSGSFEQAKRLVRQDFYIGIGCYVTSRKATHLHETVRKLPLETLLLETDAPDRPGLGHRGELNEPAYLTEVVHFIAKLRSDSPEHIAEICNHNAKELFKL